MRINLFKPGTHTDSSGTPHTFSEADVRQIAASYDPAKHQAPYVVGHPQTDAPAYGWVNRLQYADGILSVADDEKVDPSFTQLVNDGRFNKISVRLWHPTDPGNPAPGQWYLRHIGFLGAAAPAVQGLGSASFQGESGTVEFSAAFSYGERRVVRLFRQLREFLIAQFGVDKAGPVLPSDEIDWLMEDAIADELRPAEPSPFRPTSAYNATATTVATTTPSTPPSTGPETALQPTNGGYPLSTPAPTHATAPTAPAAGAPSTAPASAAPDPNFAAREANLAAREAALQAGEAALAAQQRARLQADHAAFADGLIQQGRLLPKDRDVTVNLLNSLAGLPADPAFSAPTGGQGVGQAATPQTPLVAYKAQLAAMPKQVMFSAVAGADATQAAPLPDDPAAQGAELAKRAQQYMATEAQKGVSVTLTAAIQHVSQHLNQETQ